jgi:hypothetical protein
MALKHRAVVATVASRAKTIAEFSYAVVPEDYGIQNTIVIRFVLDTPFPDVVGKVETPIQVNTTLLGSKPANPAEPTSMFSSAYIDGGQSAAGGDIFGLFVLFESSNLILNKIFIQVVAEVAGEKFVFIPEPQP